MRLTALLLLILLAPSAVAARPNVLLLICDDLNCDLGCYGDPVVQSPSIDKLANRGTRFTQAHCQFPLCGPSRASMMTGLYPDQTRIRQNAIRIRQTMPNVIAMPQAFRAADYLATRIGKIYHYGVPRHIGTAGHDDPYSWNQTHNPRGIDVADEPKIFTLRPRHFGGTLSWLASGGTDEEQTDGIAATIACEFLSRRRPTDAPFFLAVGMYRPHTPYVAPKSDFDRYPTDSITVPTVPAGYLDTLPPPARQTLTAKKHQRNLPDHLGRRAIQAYHASITFVDRQIGRILNTLDQTDLADDTIVVFTSDHGYHMGQHGHWQKQTLFQDATHVPLIIAGPGISRGTATFAELVDLYPTLCDLAGVPGPRTLAGRSLAALVRDDPPNPRIDALTQHANGYTLRTDHHRFTAWGNRGDAGVELYDVTKDPAEMRNLADAPEHQSTLGKLRTRLFDRVDHAAKKPAGLKQLEASEMKGIPTPSQIKAILGKR